MTEARLKSLEEGFAAMELEKGSSLPHRFEQEVTSIDVIYEDPEERTYILPPAGDVTTGSAVGVSFFTPINQSFAADDHYLSIRNNIQQPLQCFLVNPAELPKGLDIVQDCLLKFSPHNKEHQAVYPESFQASKPTASKQRSKPYPHGYHFSVFPRQRMLFTEFCKAVATLKRQQCKYEGGGSAGSGIYEDAGSAGSGVDKGIKDPSTMAMRVVCEALYAMWEDPNASPNDAHLAYLLQHDIRARDSNLSRLTQHDSTYTRLVYRAICAYMKSVDPMTCPFANVAGYTDSIREELEKVIPSHLHIPDSDSDGSDNLDC